VARTDRQAETRLGYARITLGLNQRDTAGGTGDLIRAIQAFISDSLALLTLEGQLAIISLIIMLAAGIFAAILTVSVWLFVLAAIAVNLVASGWPWAGVLLCVAVANSILVLICWLLIRRLSRNLLFAATRRNLGPSDPSSLHDSQTH
jgi:hypothetical protein